MIGVNRGNAARARQRKAKDLRHAGHRRGGAHGHTCPRGARDALFDLHPGLLIDIAGAPFGPIFGDIRPAPKNLAAPVPPEHRTRGNKYGGKIRADRAHTPRFTFSARSRKWLWQGLMSLQVFMMAMTGFPA